MSKLSLNGTWIDSLTSFREAAEGSEPESISKAEQLESQEESSADDEPLPAVRSYAALMQSFATNRGPQAKRRKLDQEAESRLSNEEEDPEVFTENAIEVEESEEGPETATDGVLEEDEPDSKDSSDPFEAHFADPDDNVLSRRLRCLRQNQWTTQKATLPKLAKVVLSLPETDENRSSRGLRPIFGPKELKLKPKLAVVMSDQRPDFDDLEQYIAASIFNYQDVLYSERRPEISEALRRLVCLHAVNHIFK